MIPAVGKNSVSGKQASKKKYESQKLRVEKSKGVRKEERRDSHCVVLFCVGSYHLDPQSKRLRGPQHDFFFKLIISKEWTVLFCFWQPVY